MVSVASLLNPEPARAPLPTSRPAPAPSAITQTVFFGDGLGPSRSPFELPTMTNTTTTNNNNNRNRASSRCRVKSPVNFPPYEALDEAALREVRRFQIHPFGSIQDSCQRIPYNSGKKDFFSRTGREYFEVFQYQFRNPDDDEGYSIMWDYNVGLVRMTPFFKCLKYGKTTPAKMLNQNPGLKDITYSITGGSIKAQGYWMPFACAKAVCATFCHKIAGALIPLFGPQFPFECVSDKEPGYARMIIDRNIVYQARREAEALRARALLPSPRSSRSLSPLPSQLSGRLAESYNYHPEYRRELLLSPYGTDTDVDIHPRGETDGRPPYPPIPPLQTGRRRPSITAPPTPLHSPGWTSVNQPSYHLTYPPRSSFQPSDELPSMKVAPSPNPWLSAVPRSPTPAARTGQRYSFHPTSSSSSTRFPDQPVNDSGSSAHPHPRHGTKRSFDQVKAEADEDRAYDARESSQSHSQTESTLSPRPLTAAGQEHTDYDADNDDDDDNSRVPPPVPPPSPIAGAKKATSNPMTAQSSRTSSSTSALRNNTNTDTNQRQAHPRPAAERDAAIMLMHMRARSIGERHSDDDDDDDDGPNNPNSPNKSPSGTRSDDGDDDAASKTSADTSIEVSRSPLPCSMSSSSSSSTSSPATQGGPNTRVKRRRTVTAGKREGY